MGGIGSGNWFRHGTKDMCESLCRVDVRYMRKNGLLKLNTRGTLSWSRGGESVGWISYECFESHLELNFRTRRAGWTDWEDVRQIVALERIPQPFGGFRQYFNCPKCAKRCLVLYSKGNFLCRKCQNLAYQSQNDDPVTRAQMRSRDVIRKLGGNYELNEFLPQRPKGMHITTYKRLCLLWEKDQTQVESAIALMQQRFGSYLDQ